MYRKLNIATLTVEGVMQQQGVTMRIVSWNCNGALRNKTEVVDELHADILLVQECENPDLSTAAYRKWAGNFLWTGRNKNKGIGVFANKSISFEALDWDGTSKIEGIRNNNPATRWRARDLETFLPIKIDGKINLVAAWTKAPEGDKTFGYMGQFWKYLQVNADRFSSNPLIAIGDFNSNAIWDQPHRWWNHSDVVGELSDIGIVSAYHSQTGQTHGDEATATFYMHRNLAKKYHIDYIFASKPLLIGSNTSIGKPEGWLKYSDHMPLIFDITI